MFEQAGAIKEELQFQGEQFKLKALELTQQKQMIEKEQLEYQYMKERDAIEKNWA